MLKYVHVELHDEPHGGSLLEIYNWLVLGKTDSEIYDHVSGIVSKILDLREGDKIEDFFTIQITSIKITNGFIELNEDNIPYEFVKYESNSIHDFACAILNNDPVAIDAVKDILKI